MQALPIFPNEIRAFFADEARSVEVLPVQVLAGARTAAAMLLCSVMVSGAGQAGGPVQIAEGESKTVYVAGDRVTLQSAPNEEGYPVRSLQSGDSLEAYMATDDGWLAVRPPSGSFSWVPARQAYLLPGGKVIEITVDDAVSWIGSEIGSAKRYGWQVKLRRGEQLAVLGEAVREEKNEGQSLWYKVAPPDGEFRWIYSADVVQDRSELNSVQPAAGEAKGESDGAAVKTAGYDQSILETYQGEAVQDAETIAPGTVQSPSSSGEYVEGVVVDGDVFGDAVVEDGVVYHDEGVVGAPVHTHAQDRWDGWHAWEFADDGLHFTFLERLFGKNRGQHTHDPLAHDPFSLEMVKGRPNVHMMPPADEVVTVVEQPPLRRRRPWRDPRTLREGREQDYYSSSADSVRLERPTAGELLSSIRENVEAIGSGGTRPDPIGAFGNVSRIPSLDNGGFRSSGASSGYNGVPSSIDAGIDIDDDVQWYGTSDFNSQRPTLAPNASSASYGRPLPSSGAYQSGGVAAAGDSVVQLQNELSRVVAGPSSGWDLRGLAVRAERLIDAGATPLERGQARLLLDRIVEFEQHARRTAFAPSGAVTRASFTPGAANVTQSNSGVVGGIVGSGVVTAGYVAGGGYVSPANAGFTAGGGAGMQSSVAPNGFEDESPYDATGWLVPVHNAAPGQPSHALTDDAGRIIAYLSGLPGMRLDSYINRPVGVIGLRGYLPQLRAGHIQAQRIIDLRS